MLVLAGTLIALLLVRPLGGRPGALSALQLRLPGLVPLALLCQVLALEVLAHGPRPLLVALHALSYVLAGGFVWRNRAVPGLWLVACGAALNATAIAANDGSMPASESAVRAAGLPLVEEGFSNSGIVDDPRLLLLGDVFASPSWLPLQNVYSIGDLLLLAGAVWAVHRSCGTVLARDPRPALARLRARTAA